jgi:benzoate/toluate 1,2-dioxygenase reductase subunit
MRTYSSTLLSRNVLSAGAFEIEISRPDSFDFNAGQCIRFIHKGLERDYSMISAPDDPTIGLCIRNIPSGRFTSFIASAEIGTPLCFTGPHGYFTYRPSDQPVVFIATGTGIAPFLSMSRSGISGFTLLHGVRKSEDLYYEEFFRRTAADYVPCLSACQGDAPPGPGVFHGRVTAYLESHLSRRPYNFYLCGRIEMIRDATLLADEYFSGSLVYSEIFF